MGLDATLRNSTVLKTKGQKRSQLNFPQYIRIARKSLTCCLVSQGGVWTRRICTGTEEGAAEAAQRTVFMAICGSANQLASIITPVLSLTFCVS